MESYIFGVWKRETEDSEEVSTKYSSSRKPFLVMTVMHASARS